MRTLYGHLVKTVVKIMQTESVTSHNVTLSVDSCFLEDVDKMGRDESNKKSGTF